MKAPNLKENMVVYSADGAKLGKIVACRPDGFIVGKGIFFQTASHLHYDDVAELRDGEVFLRHTKARLADESAWTMREDEVRRPAWTDTAAASVAKAAERAAETVKDAISPRAAAVTAALEKDEVRVRLAEEEVTAEKHMRDIGEVRVHKRVVVKQKQITVPVMHEEVRVERIPLEHRPANELAEDGRFSETTVSIPLHEEDVEIHKRAVLKEEVRVSKQMVSEERTETTDFRTEELDIEEPVQIAERHRKSA